jgi:predicted unusual protein kinase regulating ubiquinone biosynthesis (AarF/ABC1/UbiB family)
MSAQLRRAATIFESAVRILGGILQQLPACAPWQGGDRTRLSEVAATEVRQALGDLGPTFVKFGQLIASSPGVFPPVLAQSCRQLLCHVPPIPSGQVRALVTGELGADPDVVFASFDAEPLAAASISQVHAASLHDGRSVVVKLQRPGIAKLVAADLAWLRRVARLADRFSARARVANPVALVNDFAVGIASELDFCHEARSMEHYRAAVAETGLAGEVRIPEVCWELTSSRLLTMERIDGRTVEDLMSTGELPGNSATLLRRMVRAWLTVLAKRGLVHGDLHAGNIAVDKEDRAVILDFGITGHLNLRTRTLITHELVALVVGRDYGELARTMCELTLHEHSVDVASLAQDLTEALGPITERPLAEIDLGHVLALMIETGLGHGLRLPPALVLVSKQLLYFERYSKVMAPGWCLLTDGELVGGLLAGSAATAAS